MVGRKDDGVVFCVISDRVDVCLVMIGINVKCIVIWCIWFEFCLLFGMG